jgi:4'-phosphopantetheinyl transferase EntD
MENNMPGPIATLDSSILTGSNYENFLSPREREQLARFRAPLRKSEWLAGRLAAKHVFLSEQSGTISVEDLSRFPLTAYRSTEVMRSDAVRFGVPQVVNADLLRDVAISHTNGFACALLGSGETIALDIEQVQSRSAVFYQGNFTERERAWTEESAHVSSLSPHWSFTLLWSIKECLLKTPAYNNLSLWHMPLLDVRVVSGEDNLVQLQSAREISGSFLFLNVEVTDRNTTVPHRVAVSGRHDLVVTAIRGVDRRAV